MLITPLLYNIVNICMHIRYSTRQTLVLVLVVVYVVV